MLELFPCRLQSGSAGAADKGEPVSAAGLRPNEMAPDTEANAAAPISVARDGSGRIEEHQVGLGAPRDTMRRRILAGMTSARDTGVTVIVRRRVRPSCVAEFEAWLDRIGGVARRFPGHMGVVIARPQDVAVDDYVVVFRFDSDEHLAAWQQSDERAAALAEVEPCLIRSTIETQTGLEFWFTPPADAAGMAPSRPKMALVTLLGLYPLILFVVPVLGSLLADVPIPVATLISLAVVVALMTYAVMPLLTRALAFWLFSRNDGT